MFLSPSHILCHEEQKDTLVDGIVCPNYLEVYIEEQQNSQPRLVKTNKHRQNTTGHAH